MGIRHLRFRLSGILYTSGQTWSVGVNFMPAVEGAIPTAPIASEEGLNTWSAAIRALNGGQIVPAAMLEGLSTSGKITTVRCSDVDSSGHEDAVSVIELGTAVSGSGGAVHPGQVALAVTTLTRRPGASYRGRFYWPALGYPINGAGRINAGLRDPIATAIAQWFADLQVAGAAVTPVGIGANVVSNTRGVANRVEKISVGDRLDIQRRRADKEKETYGVASVPD